MNPAQKVAEQRTLRFLEGGNYVSAVPLNREALGGLIPAASRVSGRDPLFEEHGFDGLFVQAVGYEAGVEEPKVHVYVAKGSRRGVQTVPTSTGEVAIEVNRIGKLVVRPEQAISSTHSGNVFVRNDRIACGSSCAPSTESYAGTFGAIVRKKPSGPLYILSNNHVLAACNHTPVGMPILSPSSVDARPNVRAPGEIAQHEEIVELRSGVPSLVAPLEVDVAIARVPDPKRISSWQGDAAAGYDTPVDILAPGTGLRVKKFGRTTGLTTGTVEAALTLTTLPYKTKSFSATVYFTKVWTVLGDHGAAFALPGDSGSLVVTEDGSKAVGLVFAAGQGGYGVIIPMTVITTCFGGIRLVEKHGV